MALSMLWIKKDKVDKDIEIRTAYVVPPQLASHPRTHKDVVDEVWQLMAEQPAEEASWSNGI